MLKKVLLGVGAVVAVFLAYVAFLPTEYHFQREVLINASPEAIFPHVNNTRKMNAWNPFVKMDADIKLGYSGPEEGVGAASSFEGKNVGQGNSVITESVPFSIVRSNLEFIKPFAGTQTVDFKLAPQGAQTNVTWAIFGHNNFLSRLMCVFMSMDKMMGATFEKGLADLKAVAEAK